jgi:hypothetical protein
MAYLAAKEKSADAENSLTCWGAKGSYVGIARHGVAHDERVRGEAVSRRPASFLESDIRRALSAAQKAGPAWRVEILPGGTIRLVQGDLSPQSTGRPSSVPVAPEKEWRL